jgi:pilus assembly protein Flp/PilA
MTRLVRRFLADESGATAVEYGLMVALVALAIIAAVRLLGTSTKELFEDPELNAALGGS